MQSCLQVGGSSIVSETFYKRKEKSTCFILQQIFDLKKLQTDGSNSLSFIRRQEHSDVSSIESDSTWKLENNLDQHLQHSLGLDSEFEYMGCPNQDLHIDPFALPFLQLDHLTSFATGGSPLQGDSIWQCKKPSSKWPVGYFSGYLRLCYSIRLCKERCWAF